MATTCDCKNLTSPYHLAKHASTPNPVAVRLYDRSMTAKQKAVIQVVIATFFSVVIMLAAVYTVLTTSGTWEIPVCLGVGAILDAVMISYLVKGVKNLEVARDRVDNCRKKNFTEMKDEAQTEMGKLLHSVYQDQYQASFEATFGQR